MVDLPLVPVMAMTVRPSRIVLAPQVEVRGDGDAGFARDEEDRPVARHARRFDDGARSGAASIAALQLGRRDELGVLDVGVAAVDGDVDLEVRRAGLEEGAGGAGLAAGAIEQDGLVKAHGARSSRRWPEGYDDPRCR